METASHLEEILSHYDLGSLVSQQQDRRGTVNTSFAIETDLSGQRRRYFLRQYKRGIKEEELQFEHAIIDHIASKPYPPIARVHPTKAGATYVVEQQAGKGGDPLYYAIFDFLPGDDRYTWVDPRCTDAEITRSAQILAQFHSALADFSPRGRRAEPGIIEFLPMILVRAVSAIAHSKNTVFDRCMHDKFPLIQSEAAQVISRLKEQATLNLPKTVIHSDYHPGNLKFDGEDVVGLFDFDWSKIDVRLFDLALGIFYFLVDWKQDTDGALRLEQSGVFLTAYQQECIRLQCLPGLTQHEMEYLPTMIRASNLYVMNWAIQDYYGKDVNPQEYLRYLQHNIHTIHWFSAPANIQALQEVISVCSTAL